MKMSKRMTIAQVSLGMALFVSGMAAEAQAGKALLGDPAKHAGAPASIASKGGSASVATGATALDPLLGGPTAYDDAKLGSFGAPKEMPAPLQYEKMTDIPPTPTERLALAPALRNADLGMGNESKMRKALRATPASNGMPTVYPGDVYSQDGVGKESVYPAPW
ncbi:hypothetical protein [Burkholderia vietnamiensis]|jgi:hypothetical protein|uniref:hypothetical protein n=1 Tax=Burkholderia vietnamiensis TaxID=60552 RepID=UPI0010417752|nr:hypothetical protein [Burkholderia vietnamiensis]